MDARDLGIKLEVFSAIALFYLGPVIATLASQWSTRRVFAKEDVTELQDGLKAGLWCNLIGGCCPASVAIVYSLPQNIASGVPSPLYVFLLVLPLFLAPFGAFLILRDGRGWVRIVGPVVSVVVMVTAAFTFFGGMVAA